MLIPATSCLSQESAAEKFSKGVTLYTSGDYQGAINIWIDLYNTGYRSAELNYNLGNAYFKIQNIPGAVLFYERARLLKPTNEDINYNLQIARTLTVDKFQEIPELFFKRWFSFMSLLLSSDAWAIISILTFILCLAAISLYIYSSKYVYKVAGFWTGVLMFIISFTSMSLSINNKNQVHNSHKAIIFSPVVSGKSSPDLSGTDLFVLHEGTKVTIVDEVGEWYEIRLSDGNKGWVAANSLNII
jgi:tetratricopeptide (TPR) repeat protein